MTSVLPVYRSELRANGEVFVFRKASDSEKEWVFLRRFPSEVEAKAFLFNRRDCDKFDHASTKLVKVLDI